MIGARPGAEPPPEQLEPEHDVPGGDGSAGEAFFDGLFRALQWLFIDGPDPVANDDPPGLLEVLLPWPVRWLSVVLLVWAASFWRGSGAGQQLSWGLLTGALCLVSIIAAFWLAVLIVDGILAAAWLVPFAARRDAPRRWVFLHVITFVNRQVEHVKALLVWSIVALASSSSLSWQVFLLAVVFLLGVPVINGLARLPLPFLEADSTSKASGGLLWRRRFLIYATTLIGLLCIALRAPGQLSQIALLLVAFAGGLLLRIGRHAWRLLRVRRSDQLGARELFREQQAQAADQADAGGPLLVLAALAAVVGISFWQRQQLAHELAAATEGGGDEAACQRDPDGPLSSDIALLALADTQTHELSGKPFPGQSEIAQALVRVAARPVALDLLSSVPIARFLDLYRTLVEQRKEQHLSPPLWAHLGDLADLGCKGELQRMTDQLAGFARLGPVASIAVGNHESSFEGSFHWSPYWDSACKSGRLSPDDTVDHLGSALGKWSAPARELVRLPAPFLNPSGAALASVVRLGVAKHRGVERGVLGVFLDTSDGRAFDWGLPGALGSVSDEQITRTETAISWLRDNPALPDHEAYQHPVYVLFAHVPFDALAASSRQRVTQLIRRLDAQDSLAAEPSVLALISAHTHVAGSRTHCIGDRHLLREIVIGSTVDPPQQAALIEIGSNRLGQLALRARTLAAVARPGLTCDGGFSAVTSADCHALAASLRRQPACQALLADEAQVPRDCQELEQASTLSGRLAAVRTYRGPLDEGVKRELDQIQARLLLECICQGDAACAPGSEPLADEAYLELLREQLDDPQRKEALVCLAWAAGAMQAHKDTGMTLGEALRCAFDDPTVPAERVTVATLKAATCY
jgi:hypothetical protein